MTEGSAQKHIKYRAQGKSLKIENDFHNMDASIEAHNFDSGILETHEDYSKSTKSSKFKISGMPILQFLHRSFCRMFVPDMFLEEVEHKNLSEDELKRPKKDKSNIFKNIDDPKSKVSKKHEKLFECLYTIYR